VSQESARVRIPLVHQEAAWHQQLRDSSSRRPPRLDRNSVRVANYRALVERDRELNTYRAHARRQQHSRDPPNPNVTR